jgi:hypothetical protein
MSKQEDKLEQKSPSKTEIRGALDGAELNQISDLELDKVTGGLRKAGGDSREAGTPFLVYKFSTVFTK